jgi:hypothetical protein
VLHDAGIPAYDTPLRAVRGFMHIVAYRRGQRALQRTPPSIPRRAPTPDLVRAIVNGALAEKRQLLTEPEAKRVLAAYGIPVVPTEIVLDASEAAARRDPHRLPGGGEKSCRADHAQVDVRRRGARSRARSRPVTGRRAPMTDKVWHRTQARDRRLRRAAR